MQLSFTGKLTKPLLFHFLKHILLDLLTLMIQFWTWFCTITIQSINPRTSAVSLSHYHSLFSVCLNFIPPGCLCNSMSDHTVPFNLIQAVNQLFSVPSGNMQIIQGTLLGVQKMGWTKEGRKRAEGLSIKRADMPKFIHLSNILLDTNVFFSIKEIIINTAEKKQIILG